MNWMLNGNERKVKFDDVKKSFLNSMVLTKKFIHKTDVAKTHTDTQLA